MIQARIASWIPYVTGLIVLGSLAVVAAPVTWHLTGTVAVDPDSASRPVAATFEPPAPVDIGPVLALAPFGQAEVAQAKPDAPAPLDMVLLGIISRDDPAESMALIFTSGQQANYKPGNKIGQSAILDQVNANHVVLLIDGKRSILGFPNADPIESDDPDITATSGNSMEDLLAAAMAPPATEEYAEPPPPPPPVTTQDYIDLWRERIRANPKQVLDEIGLVAGDRGYTISENHDSGVTRAGLKAGDLVKSVNGKPVGDVDSDRILYDEVASSGLARVEIERDGRSIVLSFPLQ